MTTTMTTTTKRRWLTGMTALLAVAASTVLVSCGGGADRTKAQVRLVNATGATGGYASLDLRVDDSVRQSGITYAGTDTYVEVDPDDADTVLTRNGSSSALLSFTPSLSKNKHYSVLAYGAEGALKQLLLDENTSAPDNNRTLLRVVNAAPDAGALDVYITGSEEALATSVPVQLGAAFGTLNSFLTQISGTYTIRVAATGSKTDLRLTLPNITLSSKQITTLVLTPARGGVLINALLVNQQNPINRLDSTQARVRAVAGVTNTAGVVARVGTNADIPPLLDNNAPVIGAYTLLTAGSQPVQVTVNGATVTQPNKDLVAGSDYTLLVWGPADAPKVNWIVDDNRLPTDTTQARLRLVNGVAEAPPLAMTLNLNPIVTGTVAGGSASAYGTVTPTTTGRLNITTSGQTTPVPALVDQIFTAGATYSVFVLGAQASAIATLSKDR